MRTKKLNLVIVPLGKTICFRDGRRPGLLNNRYKKSLRRWDMGERRCGETQDNHRLWDKSAPSRDSAIFEYIVA